MNNKKPIIPSPKKVLQPLREGTSVPRKYLAPYSESTLNEINGTSDKSQGATKQE